MPYWPPVTTLPGPVVMVSDVPLPELKTLKPKPDVPVTAPKAEMFAAPALQLLTDRPSEAPLTAPCIATARYVVPRDADEPLLTAMPTPPAPVAAPPP